MASLCNAFGALEKTSYPYSFAKAQRLCEAYEAYCACRPQTAMELEDVFLLVDALGEGRVIRLGQCRGCGCAIIVANYELGPRVCMHCTCG
jgi:hypothetical protein